MAELPPRRFAGQRLFFRLDILLSRAIAMPDFFCAACALKDNHDLISHQPFFCAGLLHVEIALSGIEPMGKKRHQVGGEG